MNSHSLPVCHFPIDSIKIPSNRFECQSELNTNLDGIYSRNDDRVTKDEIIALIDINAKLSANKSKKYRQIERRPRRKDLHSAHTTFSV